MFFPPRLAPGARVAIVAPAGPIKAGDVERAEANARHLGWEPVVGEHVRAHDGYLAGADTERVADFNRAAADAAIDAVWCIRGGYGCARLLSSIDYDAWQRHPKALIGFSDISALHAAIGARAKLVTFHGPTARAALTPFAEASLRAAVTLGGGVDPCGRAAEATTLVGGVARGPLVGGNLAVLAGLIGTPYAPQFGGAILVLEDVIEPVYRADRHLMQLRLSGALLGVVGVAFGQFTEIPPVDSNGERPLDALLGETARALGVPFLSGVPVGHVPDQWTVPLGATAELDATNKTLSVTGITV